MMKGKKLVKFSLAMLSSVMLLTSANLSVLAEGMVNVRTTTQNQMQSAPETVFVSSYADTGVRTVNIDDYWKFNLGDVRGAEAKNFDDSKWDVVSLPHDYSIIQDYQANLDAESGFLPGGTGWYRKYFNVSQEMLNKRVRLDFDGVYMNASVYVNGTKLGMHPYGYTPFSFDITQYLNADEENVIAVKVEHKTPSSRWYSGSGIYRSVHLTFMNPVHVDLYGQKIETPNIETQLAGNVTMKVATTVKNESAENASVTVKHTVFKKGDENVVIATHETTGQDVAASASAKIDATFDTTAKPELWDTKTPNLYVVRTEVKVNGNVVDTVESDFGFRHFKMDKDHGAFLNGQKIKLKGVCMHHDQGSLGAAAYRAAIERQVDILKEMGTNSIRITHNPGAEVMIDVCNQKGMLVIDELFDGWMHTKNGNTNDYAAWFSKNIEQGNNLVGADSSMTWAQFDLTTTLKRGQNAPSIIMWSLGNEIGEGTSYEGSQDFPNKAPQLIEWAKAADSTRMLTIGSNKVKDNIQAHIQVANILTENGGASGTNYSRGNSYDELHRRFPNWLLYGSETASSVNSRGVYTTKADERLDGNNQLTSYDKSAVHWGALAKDAWYDVITRDFVAGEYIWTGFDYIGEPTPANGINPSPGSFTETSPKSSYFGIIDTAGFPKDSYYFYQSQWNDDVTTLHVLPSWNEDEIITTGSNKEVEVVVYSNAPKVRLELTPTNGQTKVIGTKEFEVNTTTDGYTYKTVKGQQKNSSALYMTFNVPFEAGTLKAVALDENDKPIENTVGRNQVVTSTAPAQLKATTKDTTIVADNHDLAYIEVDVLDANGNMVNDATNRVTFTVEGDGILVGVDNGSSPDHDSYKINNRRAHAGKVLAIVKATNKAGQFTVTASAEGLTPSSVSVTTTPVNQEVAAKAVQSYKLSRNFYVKQGVQPTLPTEVELTYADGTKELKAVTWADITAEQLQSKEPFTVKGTVTDANIDVFVNVNMIEGVAEILNYSTTVQKGATYVTLPTSRPAVLLDGTVLNAAFNIEWEQFDTALLNTVGTFVVRGTANVFGVANEVTATIRVQEEQFEVAGNIARSAILSQDIEEAYQSDNLQAIIDGNKNFLPVSGGRNDKVWSNYKNSQTSTLQDNPGNDDNTAKITFAYDTQTTINQMEVTFFRDSWSSRYPKANTVQIYIDDSTTPLAVTELIGEEQTTRIKTYTYKFAPVNATKIHLLITNSDEAAANANIRPCTGITEVTITKVTGKFTSNSTAELQSLTLNGTALTAEQIAQGYVTTPALIANLENVVTKDNASYTILPAHNNVVKVILESEDGSTTKTFEVRLDVAPEFKPNDAANDITLTDGMIRVYNQHNDAHAKGNLIDGNTESIWHTKWGSDLADTEDKRFIEVTFENPTEVNGLRYLSRPASGGYNGNVTKYRVEYKANNTDTTWTMAAEGNWPRESGEWRGVEFTPVTAKQIRLVGVETIADSGNNKFMSAAEFRLTKPRQTTDLSGFTTTLSHPNLKDGVITLPSLAETEAVTPAVSVKNGEVTLTQGVDYKVSYVNNTSFNENAKVIVEGIDKYSGTIEIPFKIVQEVTITGVTIADKPTKLEYNVGEKFDPTGLKLNVEYSNGTTETIVYSADTASLFTFNPTLDTVLDENVTKVTVTYANVAMEIDVTVTKVVAPEVDKTELLSAIEKYSLYKKDDYTGDWDAFTSALNDAKNVADNKEATVEQVTYALNALNNAAKGLKPVEKPTPTPNPDPTPTPKPTPTPTPEAQDKAPIVKVGYGYNADKTVVSVVLDADQDCKTPQGWKLNGSGKTSFVKTFDKNGTYKVVVESVNGKQTTVTFTITDIVENTDTKPAVKPTDKPVVDSGWDSGAPFTTDECGSVYDRWGNLMWKAPTCKVAGTDGYNIVNTQDK